jgi:hypothetical protein
MEGHSGDEVIGSTHWRATGHAKHRDKTVLRGRAARSGRSRNLTLSQSYCALVLLLQRYSTGLQLLDDVLQVFDAACKSIDPSNDERVTRTQETEQGLKLRSTSPVRSARSFGSDDITAGHPQRLFLDGEVLVERGDTRVTVKRHSAPFGSGQPHSVSFGSRPRGVTVPEGRKRPYWDARTVS